jgi:tRNA-2-methylthio-N6-dimethylallyladenosine synthase
LTEPRFLAAHPEPGKQSPTAFVTTMKGCDERCTFCIVPTTRGPERYRPSREIIDEITRLVEAGAREVTLLGQTVDSYRDPLSALPEAPGKGEDGELGQVRKANGDESEFPALLRAIAQEVRGLLRIRYTSPHPRHLTAALVLAHRDLSVLPRHVHMPVQSGSDRVLKRMARRYTVAEYIERTSRLRAAVPGLTLSTDMIVGFPGETREDFELTLKLVREVGFVGIYGFKYSPRPFTPALKLGDDVGEEEKSARLTELLELSEEIRQRHLESLVGGVEQVLVEGRGRDEAYTGRTNRNEIVHFASSSDPTGELVEVRIDRAFKHSLGGTLVDPRRALPLRDKNDAPAKQRRALPLVIQNES